MIGLLLLHLAASASALTLRHAGGGLTSAFNRDVMSKLPPAPTTAGDRVVNGTQLMGIASLSKDGLPA